VAHNQDSRLLLVKLRGTREAEMEMRDCLTIRAHASLSEMFRSLRFSLFLAALVFTCWPPATAQNATVTFYSPPDPLSHQIKEGFAELGLSGGFPFRGSIFDGEHQLASLTPSNFVRFELARGPHVFSATFSRSHPSKKYTLPLDISAGEHYFIRLTTKWKDGGIVSNPQFERVDCKIASQENATSHPLKIASIPKDAQSLISPSAAALTCP
jgi:hypothetical protein